MRVLPWDSSPRLLREYGAGRLWGVVCRVMMVELRRGSDVYRLCAGLGRARRRNAHAVNQQFVVEFYNFDLLKIAAFPVPSVFVALRASQSEP